ncbi:MFS transporter [Brachybacterium sp. EF45031]|nr:MFS transporter [Brachybacterium sillae]
MLIVLVVASLAIMLRPAAAAVGPLLEPLTTSLGASDLSAGALTALPCLVFGLAGLTAVPLARRTGLTGALVLAMLLLVVAGSVRTRVGDMGLFLPLSALALAGPALGNVVLPAWIKVHGGRHRVALMTLYSSVLSAGAFLASLLAVPLAPDTPEGWRLSLLWWVLPAVVPMLLAVVVLRRAGHDFPPAEPRAVGRTDGRRTLLRAPTAVALTALFALQSGNAYTQFGWLPRLYADAGIGPAASGALLAVVAGLGIVGGLVMPVVIDRSRHLRALCGLFGLLTAGGYVGLLLAPHAGALLWAVMLGLGGFTFPTVLALIPARSRSAEITARLSGMVQPLGYIVAALMPLGAGAVLAATGSTTLVLGLLAGSGLLLGLVGLRAAAPVVVDDELAQAR